MHIKGRLLNRAVFLINCTPFKNQAYSSFTSEEGGGSMVECLTQDRGIADSSLTGGTALCP